MITKKYDSNISKELPVNVKIKEDAVLTNYYPYYVVGKSSKIAKKIWNSKNLSMNYNIVWEAEDMNCGYPKNVGVMFRIYREKLYIAGTYVIYDCTNGEISVFNTKCQENEDIEVADIRTFVENVITIFGELAYNELGKINSRESAKQSDKAFSPRHKSDLNDENTSNNGDKKRINGHKDLYVKKNYTAISWQRHGYYKENRFYQKSCICRRNSDLLN